MTSFCDLIGTVKQTNQMTETYQEGEGIHYIFIYFFDHFGRIILSVTVIVLGNGVGGPSSNPG